MKENSIELSVDERSRDLFSYLHQLNFINAHLKTHSPEEIIEMIYDDKVDIEELDQVVKAFLPLTGSYYEQYAISNFLFSFLLVCSRNYDITDAVLVLRREWHIEGLFDLFVRMKQEPIENYSALLFSFWLIHSTKNLNFPLNEKFKNLSINYWQSFSAEYVLDYLDDYVALIFSTSKKWLALNMLSELNRMPDTQSAATFGFDLQKVTWKTKLDGAYARCKLMAESNINNMNFADQIVNCDSAPYNNVDVMVLNVIAELLASVNEQRSSPVIDYIFSEFVRFNELGPETKKIAHTHVPFDMSKTLNSAFNFLQVWNVAENKSIFNSNTDLMNFVFNTSINK